MGEGDLRGSSEDSGEGRDGAWRRWVVRDEEEMMMGCCVREMAARGASGLPPDLGEILPISFFLDGLGCFKIQRDKAWVGREMRGIRLGC